MSVWADKLNETMRQSQMPKLDIKTFTGDPLEFQSWLVAFEKLIEEATTDPVRQLHYLSQYTKGEANTLIAGYSLGQTTEDYNKAKEELKREFRNPYILANHNLHECRNYLKGSLEDRKAYVKENGLYFACLIPTRE